MRYECNPYDPSKPQARFWCCNTQSYKTGEYRGECSGDNCLSLIITPDDVNNIVPWGHIDWIEGSEIPRYKRS